MKNPIRKKGKGHKGSRSARNAIKGTYRIQRRRTGVNKCRRIQKELLVETHREVYRSYLEERLRYWRSESLGIGQ